VNSSGRIAVVTIGLGLFSPSMNAAQSSSPTFKTGITVVNVPVTVRGDGILVTNLHKNDFEIFDNGKRQEISYFAHQNDVPLNVALLVDVSGSVRQIVEDEKVTAGQFLERVLRPHDRGIIVGFSDSVVLWKGFTSSIDLLKAALSNLKPVALPAPGLTSDPRKAGTALYDAVTATSTREFPLQTGTKIIVVISDGLDTISSTTLESAVGSAQTMEVVVYSICKEDRDNSATLQYRWIHKSDMSRYDSGCSALKALSEPTGGRMFSVSKTMSMQMIFEVIGEEIRSQYLLGFSPSNPGRPGTRRKLQIRATRNDIRTTRRDLIVRGRSGYYASNTNGR